MIEPVDPKKGLPKFRNIYFENIEITDAASAVKVAGLEKSTVDGFNFKNVNIQASNAGYVKHAKDWKFENSSIKADDDSDVKYDNVKNVKLTNK